MVPDITPATFILIILNFVYLFIASGMLGLVFGLATALLLKASPSNHVHQVGSVYTPRQQHKFSGAAAVYLSQQCVALQIHKWHAWASCICGPQRRPLQSRNLAVKPAVSSVGWLRQAASLRAGREPLHAQTRLHVPPLAPSILAGTFVLLAARVCQLPDLPPCCAGCQHGHHAGLPVLPCG